MNEDVANILYGSGHLHSLRGLGPALGSEPIGGAPDRKVLGGDDLNFGQAMAAFMEGMAPGGHDPMEHALHAEDGVQLERSNLDDVALAPPKPRRKKKKQAAKIADLLSASKEGEESSGEEEEVEDSIGSILAAREPKPSTGPPSQEVAAEADMSIANLLKDEEFEDAPENLQDIDFTGVDASIISVGNSLYFQTTK